MSVSKRAIAVAGAILAACAAPSPPPALWGPVITEVAFEELEFAPFVEPDFPFITTSLDATELGPGFPETNVAPRCLALRLDQDAYACFDTDLLRWAAAWTGEFLPMVTMAQISYADFFTRANQLPRVLGTPVVATGHYPGWSAGAPQLSDPRPAPRHPLDPPSGAIPAEHGRWEGVHLTADGVVLSYTVGNTPVHERPGTVTAGSEVGFTRTFRIRQPSEPLTLVAAEVTDAVRVERRGNSVFLHHASEEPAVTAVGLAGAPAGVEIRVVDERYVTVHVPAHSAEVQFAVVFWKGATEGLGEFDSMLSRRPAVPDVRRGAPSRWPQIIGTRGEIAPDTAAFVLDRLTLPLPNPWRRNVRVVDVDFFGDGRAAVLTFEGDVWIVEGIGEDLSELRWRRFASGLYEPLSISVLRDTIYTFGKEGIVRLHDLNGNGEADHYENFSNVMEQSIETREWAADMAPAPGGGFFIAKGGALDLGPRGFSPAIMTGFRAGSHHSGSILRVSPDGRSVETYATGLRGPYLAVHPVTGVVTATDQEGNFVPSTPVLLVEQGDYFGVPATAHRDPEPEVSGPLTYIPHNVDQSAIGQVWVTSDRMGPLNGALVHLSYGRPGLFQVYFDSAGSVVQGGVSALPVGLPAPPIKSAVHPRDGHLYIAGFALWGTRSTGHSALTRLRYTGRPSYTPEAFQVRSEGVYVRFGVELDSEAVTDLSSYEVKRWNYQRTPRYGSGRFTLDGSPGEEHLPVTSAHLSADGRSILLGVPILAAVDQMQLAYSIRAADGKVIADTLFFTPHQLPPFDLHGLGFGHVDRDELRVGPPVAAAPAADAEPASAARGEALVQRAGCVGCHSLDGRTQALTGPSFLGLFGSIRQFTDGSSALADAAYIRESILRPNVTIVAGFDPIMPSFEGVFSEAEMESIVLYLETLRQ